MSEFEIDFERGRRKLPFATVDVVPNPSGEKPFKVIFRRGVEVLCEWEVDSVAEGEKQILKILRTMGSKL
jgi:hypothetical protein